MRNGGFSLIVMSILLTVASLIFVSVLPGKEAGDINAKTISNEQKLERVEEAMRSFMAFNGRRPCPAQGSYKPGDANFGAEAGLPGACDTAPLGPDAGTGYIVGGTIPTRALGLPDEYAFDAWGRRFSYVIDTRATKKSSCVTLEGITPTNTTPTGTGDLKIESTNGGTVLANIMYAYISHGPSGYGAFPAQGASSAAGRINSGSTDTDEQVNAGVNSSFTYNTTNFTNVKVQKSMVAPTSGDTGFDNLVWYRPDLENTCCLGTICMPSGFRIDGTLTNGNIGGGGIAFADINNDGIPDLIMVGQDTANSTDNLYVVFGQSSRFSFPNPLQLTSANMNGTIGFELKGLSTNATWGAQPYLGNATITVGDVNGDGIPDIIIDVQDGNCNGVTYAYVIFGQNGGSWPTTPTSISSYNNSTTPQVAKLQSGTNCNYTVNVADVNHDGINDIIFGDLYSSSGRNQSGRVFVYFGHPTQTELTNNTYPNGPQAIWPSQVNISDLKGGTAAATTAATPTFVQDVDNTGNTTKTLANSFGSATTSGDTIMVALSNWSSNPAISAGYPQDTQGNTFTQVGSTLTTPGGSHVRVYYASNIVGGADTVTVKFASNTDIEMHITEYSGIATVNPLDVQAGASGAATGANAANSGNATTTASGDLIYAWCLADNTCTVGTGFTSRSTANGDLIEDKTAGVAGSYNATGTTNAGWGIQMVALKAGSPVPASDGIIIEGPAVGAAAGSTVAVGDLNHDGIKDIIFGNAAGGGSSMRAWIVWGQDYSFSWPNPVDLNSLTAWTSCASGNSCGVTLTQTTPVNSYFGKYQIITGDFNGDGIDDVGMAGKDSSNTFTNYYIIYGAAAANWTFTSLNVNTMASTVGVNFNNGASCWGPEDWVDLATDFNGDGKTDLLLQDASTGCSGKVGAYVALFNDAWGTNGNWNISGINGTNGFEFDIPDLPLSSYSATDAGDLNHDNTNDIVITDATHTVSGRSKAGSTYLIWGKNSYAAYSGAGNYVNGNGYFDTSSTYQGTAWSELDGDYANEYSGANIAHGDIDHDGSTDIAIGAPGNTPSSNSVSKAGSVYVIFGGTKLNSEISGGANSLEQMVQ